MKALFLLSAGILVIILPLYGQEDTVRVEKEEKVHKVTLPFLRVSRDPDLNNARTKKEFEYTSNIEESETTDEEDFG